MKKSVIFVGLLALLVVFMTTFNYAKGWVEVDGIWYFERADGTRETDAILSSGEDKFYVNSNGEMARDVLLEDFNGNTYYFGSNGAMVKGTWVSVDPTALTDPGENPPGAYYFYFGQNGAAYRAKNSDVIRKTIDGQKYLFDDKGHRLYGWVDEIGTIVNDQEEPFKEAVYYCGDEYDGALRSGWIQFDGGTSDDEYYDYSSIWLYFDKSTNKKIKPDATSTTKTNEKTKKIDGQTYLFDQYGVMKHGWQDVEKKNATNYTGKFYSEDYEGQLKKKSWFYTVPPEKYDNENNSYEDDDYATDTKRWFYVDNTGIISTNSMKKVNKHYYCFDDKGIMRTGLIVWDSEKHKYKFTIDTDRMESRDYITRRVGSQDGTKNYVIDTNGISHNVLVGSSAGKFPDKVYYFYKDTDVTEKEGSRADKPVKITFTDGEFEFYSNSNGHFQGYKPKNKRIFDGGFMIKADKDIGYGLAVSTDDKISASTDYSGHAYRSVCYTSYDVKLYILDTNGSKVTKANMIKKDKNDNYWITNSKGEFQKIFNVQIKYATFTVPSKKADGGQTSGWVFKSEYNDPTKKGSTKTTFLPFGDYTFGGSICTDAYGKSCVTTRLSSVSSHCDDYTVIPTGRDYALNFYWTDKASQGPYPPQD